MASTIEIFFSYSHKDEVLREELEKHLSLLKRQGYITYWHDRKISAGTEWAGEIDAHLNTAQIILLLVSPDFMASDYCYDIEMKRALERHERGEARVIPIILRPVDWQNAPFGKLKALPTDAKPIFSSKWHTLDEAFFDVAEGIREAIKSLIDQYQEAENQSPDAEEKWSRRLQAYREALQADPRISSLQILDMNRPLTLTGVYVKVRVHQETRLSYTFDQALRLAEAQRDPNMLAEVGKKQLELHADKAIDPDVAIRKYRRCVIVGDPGAGKTTLLKYLALSSAGKHVSGLPDLPIHVELIAFVNSGYHDLLDFVATKWDEWYDFPHAEARMSMENALKEGKALLLLDALDEVVIGDTEELAELSYKRVSDVIMQLAVRYPQTPIVVTARKAGYHQRAPLIGFTELEVLGFRPDDIQKFVINWFTCSQDPQREMKILDLITRLERNPRIQELTTNPLLLSLIVLVYETQLDLPDRRVELYKRCVDTLLADWDVKRNIRRYHELPSERQQQLLEELAWHFHQQRQRYFSEQEALIEISGYLSAMQLPTENNRLILAQIANKDGLLKEQARGWYGFLHLTLQEYFAARYAVNHDQLETLLTHLGDPWWEEVLLLYAGYISDASIMLQKLLGRDKNVPSRDDLFHTNLLLAGHCLTVHPILQQTSLREEIISALFELLLATPYRLMHEHIASILATIGQPEINSELLRLLTNEQINEPLRWEIADALGRNGDKSIAPDLVRLLINKKVHYSLGLMVAEALGELQDKSVVPDLLGLLTDKKIDIDVCQGVARALGTLGGQDVVLNLLHLLSNERVSHFVRQEIAEALARRGDKSVVPNLLLLLANKKINLYVRRAIVEALGKLGDTSVVPKLLQLLTEKTTDPYMRWDIVEALGELQDKSVVPELLRLLANEKIETSLRERIAEALGELQDKSVVPDLRHIMINTKVNAAVRGRIAQVLGTLGERTMISELLELLANRQLSNYTRLSIAQSLASLGERAIIPILLQMLSDENEGEDNLSGNFVHALRRLKDKSVVPKLLPLLKDKKTKSYTRSAIIMALGELASDTSAILALIALLNKVKHDTGEEEEYHEGLSGVEPANTINGIYEALWSICRRIGVRVYISYGLVGNEEVEVVRC